MASLQKVSNIKENLHKIDISCEQMTFNPMDETVTIIACDIKNNGRKNKSTSTQNTSKYGHYNNRTNVSNESKHMKLPTLHTADATVETDRYDYCSTSDGAADTISLVALCLLVLIWVSVFIIVKIQESEYINSIYIDPEFMDEETVSDWLKK